MALRFNGQTQQRQTTRILSNVNRDVHCQYLQLLGPRSVHTLLKMKCLAEALWAIVLLFVGCLVASTCHAQDLAPRAYIITPLHSNALNLTYSYLDGSLIFDGTVPITDAKARVSLSRYNSLPFTQLFWPHCYAQRYLALRSRKLPRDRRRCGSTCIPIGASL